MSRKKRQRQIQTVQHKLDQAPRRNSVIKQEISGQLFVNPLCSDYENLFPQLRPLINEMKMVHPFGVGRNGARLPLSRTPELAALEYPNDDMGWDEFMDLVYSTWLTEREALIWAHKSPRGKILGYTMLPVGSRKWVGGEERFSFITTTGESIELSRDEVMVLRFSRSPKNPDQGVSPATVAHFWAQIQDLLAQYQKAYIENGAVPASITFITAPTQESYNEKRRALETGLSGAQNKNKTIYAWRHILPDNTMGDEIEVKTIQGNNSTLAIRDIMEIASDQLNKAVGVSNFILGDDSSAKYDNAELSTQQFMLHRVYPALVSFWNQFQHELDRITGGLGYAIDFDLEIPELTEQSKVKAETKKIEAETNKIIVDMENQKDKSNAEVNTIRINNIKMLIDSGVAARDAVNALGLDDIKWLRVAQGMEGSKSLAGGETGVSDTISESSDNSISDEVRESGQVSDMGGDMDSTTHVNDHHCTHCQHYHDAKEPEFSPDEIIERGIYEELVALLDSLINQELGEGVVMSDREVNELIGRIEERLLEVAEKGGEESVEETEKSVNELPVAVIVGLVNGKKPTSNKVLVETIKQEQAPDGKVDIEARVKEQMQKRTDELVRRYGEEAGETIRKALSDYKEQGLTKAEIRRALEDKLPKARAEMIARSEVAEAFRIGKLEEMKHLSETYSLRVKKTWHAHPGECPICAAMDGTTVDLLESFPEETVDEEGRVYKYDHTQWNSGGETPNAHPDCRCYFTFEVVG